MKNYLPKILITGGNGQMGQALSRHAMAKHFQIFLFSHQTMNIADRVTTHEIISRVMPDFIINTAAYTLVDKAEENIAQAMLVNDEGAKNVSRIADSLNIPLIHLSTDYVFDGSKKHAYEENDTTNPINIYGLSKWQGEQAVRKYCRQHIILRLSAIFSEYGKNFYKTMLASQSTLKNELNIVTDQITCPTYAGHIAHVVYTLLTQPLTWGTYHYCDTPAISWHGFASAIFAQIDCKKNINAIAYDDYFSEAKRPRFSVLDCKKIELDYGITQFAWDEGILWLSGTSL